jgi:ribonuclease G
MDDGQIQELLIERDSEKGIVGNIYKGRVTRVLPGMQAAFVDVGLDKAAFLYVDDIYVHPEVMGEETEVTPDESETSEYEELSLEFSPTFERMIKEMMNLPDNHDAWAYMNPTMFYFMVKHLLETYMKSKHSM